MCLLLWYGMCDCGYQHLFNTGCRVNDYMIVQNVEKDVIFIL